MAMELSGLLLIFLNRAATHAQSMPLLDWDLDMVVELYDWWVPRRHPLRLNANPALSEHPLP